MKGEDGKPLTSYRFTLQDIADEFKMSKGAVSDVSNKYVRAGILVPRYSKMKEAQAKTVDFLGLPSHSKDSGRKKGTHSILHPFYWSDEVKKEVSKKFGSYSKLEKDTNHEKTLEAWEFGKKVYLGWMKAFVRSQIENSEIQLHHGKTLGEMGDLTDDIGARISEAELSELDADDLSTIDNPSED